VFRGGKELRPRDCRRALPRPHAKASVGDSVQNGSLAKPALRLTAMKALDEVHPSGPIFILGDEASTATGSMVEPEYPELRWWRSSLVGAPDVVYSQLGPHLPPGFFVIQRLTYRMTGGISGLCHNGKKRHLHLLSP